MATMQDVFDQIAPGWYNFRHRTRFRSELEALAQRWRGGRLLNIGCAHGPDFVPFRQGFELHGIDFSPEMLRFARKYSKKSDFVVNLSLADFRCLPYRDESFHWAIAVASYHHVKGREEVLKSLQELSRVLKRGGEAFVTVWNRWQPGFWFRGKEVMVLWRVKGNPVFRYHYLFSNRELKELAEQAGFAVKSFPEGGCHFPARCFSRNICLLLRKGD